MPLYEALVVGSGPNGLAAAITLAQAGVAVKVFEASTEIGGGVRSLELTLPSFVHDVCSAVHPLAVVSPFFRSIPLADFGLRWISPPAALAHPLEGGTAVILEESLEATASALAADGKAYRRLFTPLVRQADVLFKETLGPLAVPRHPLILARFGFKGMRSAKGLAESSFKHEPARALLGGVAAHSFLKLSEPFSSAIALMLTVAAHARGWPIPAGGSRTISSALAGYLKSLGGEIITGCRISSLDELPPARVVMLDVGVTDLIRICGKRLPGGYLKKLLRYKQAPGVFKMDWALSDPVPWESPRAREAGTVHLGGSLEEISQGEARVQEGEHPEQPFVLVTQPSLFDPSRAPPGKHTLWAYCHVPNGSARDMSDQIESQIERFAPGFRDCILAKSVMSPADLERYNSNCTGGDISGGSVEWTQLLSRPVSLFHPYKIPLPGLYLCSASTPPGPGVHGMCGYHAARAALEELRR